MESFYAGSIYPASFHLYEDYIITPIYINYLLLLLHISTGFKIIIFGNILLNAIQLFIFTLIIKKIWGEKFINSAVVSYILYLNFFGLVFFNLTELLFGVFLLLTIYFYLFKKNMLYILSGISTYLTLGIRPVGWSIIVALVITSIVFYKNKEILKGNIIVALSFCIMLTIAGFTINNSFGHFIFTSTNGGANLLIGANEDAHGGFTSKVFEKGKAGFIEDIEKRTYYEKNNFWSNAAINWIKENPIRWLLLIPQKFIHIFARDDFAFTEIIGGKEINLFFLCKHFYNYSELSTIFQGMTSYQKNIFWLFQILHHIYYFLLVVLIAFAIRDLFKNPLNVSFIFILGIITISIVIPLLTSGDARYKYPFILLGLIIATPGFNQIITNIFKIKLKK